MVLRGLPGIAVMFVLNLSASFACSPVTAARGYELPAGDVRGILTGDREAPGSHAAGIRAPAALRARRRRVGDRTRAGPPPEMVQLRGAGPSPAMVGLPAQRKDHKP